MEAADFQKSTTERNDGRKVGDASAADGRWRADPGARFCAKMGSGQLRAMVAGVDESAIGKFGGWEGRGTA